MKVKLIIAVFLVAGAILVAWLIKYQYERIISLESQKNELELKLDEKEQQIEKAKQANLEANREIKKLRQLKAQDNAVADWYNTPLPDSVIMLLQERYSKHN